MRLSFYGAVEEVTGSMHAMVFAHGTVVVDCGMHQGERLCATKNLDPFGVNPSQVTALCVTHAHLDHTGRIPMFVAQGFSGTIFMTAATKALAEIILEDSVHILHDNAKRCGDAVPYDEAAVRRAMSLVHTVEYGERIDVLPGVTATFYDAGHILGSSFVAFDVPAGETKSGKAERVVFSGDIGNDDVPILPDTAALGRADIVVCESTYGATDHEPSAVRSTKLAAFVKEIVGKRGTVLIPAFSVERTQEILYEIDRLLHAREIPDLPVYLDSPLAIRATEIYKRFRNLLSFDHPAMAADTDFLAFKNLRQTPSVEDSKAIALDHRPKVIIAGNGMMTGGRILHHMRRYLDDERNGLLVVGFQAPGTLGRSIEDGAKEATIFGERVLVRARVEKIEAYSAHGDRGKLARWLTVREGAKPHVFLVHGEPQTKVAFAEYLKQKIGVAVTIPRQNEVFEV